MRPHPPHHPPHRVRQLQHHPQHQQEPHQEPDRWFRPHQEPLHRRPLWCGVHPARAPGGHIQRWEEGEGGGGVSYGLVQERLGVMQMAWG